MIVDDLQKLLAGRYNWLNIYKEIRARSLYRPEERGSGCFLGQLLDIAGGD